MKNDFNLFSITDTTGVFHHRLAIQKTPLCDCVLSFLLEARILQSSALSEIVVVVVCCCSAWRAVSQRTRILLYIYLSRFGTTLNYNLNYVSPEKFHQKQYFNQPVIKNTFHFKNHIRLNPEELFPQFLQTNFPRKYTMKEQCISHPDVHFVGVQSSLEGADAVLESVTTDTMMITRQRKKYFIFMIRNLFVLNLFFFFLCAFCLCVYFPIRKN